VLNEWTPDISSLTPEQRAQVETRAANMMKAQ